MMNRHSLISKRVTGGTSWQSEQLCDQWQGTESLFRGVRCCPTPGSLSLRLVRMQLGCGLGERWGIADVRGALTFVSLSPRVFVS